VQKQESPSSYKLTSLSLTRQRALHAAEAQQATSQLSCHAISDTAGGLRSEAGKGQKTCTQKACRAATCGLKLMETANETAAVTDVVSQVPDKMSFIGGTKAASISARPSVRVRARTKARARVKG